MEDLEVGKFKIEAFHGVTLSNEDYRYYNGNNEPYIATFAIIQENEDYCNLVEFEYINKNFDKFKVTQLVGNTTEEEINNLVNSNKKWFDELIQYKIDNPDYNGDM